MGIFEEHSKVISHLRDSFSSGKTLPVAFRIKQLERFRDMISENEDAICEALHKDLHKPKAEAVVYETLYLLNEVNTAIAEVKHWVKPTKVSRTLLQVTDAAYLHKDPLGVVLIIGAWNYPIQLPLCPVIGAIAAGNCVVLKPSEVSPNSEKLLTELVSKYLDSDIISVITGGPNESSELLKQRFDHIFYTGSTQVGKIIMKAAVEHLTPVTLELGGKCPVILDGSTDVATTARRIVWGKFANCGQTCIGVDYILCPKELRASLVENLKKNITEFYGEDPQKSDDYGRFCHERHFSNLFSRVAGLLERTKGKVVHGGKCDKAELYIEPTIVEDVAKDDSLMQEEIFGPILPIIDCDSVEEAVKFVNAGEKPLTLYMFSTDQKKIDYVMGRTSSGNVTINDILMHMTLDTLPFGGVGHSGMGRYHGKYSFDTFTHEKAVLHRTAGMDQILWMRYPPYDEKKMSWARTLITKRKIPFL